MKKLPIFFWFLVVGCAVVLLELGVVTLYDSLPVVQPEDLLLAHRLEKLKDPAAYDILVLGDSTAGSGINPHIIHQQTGLSVYNFSTYRNIVSYADNTLLERYLQNHPSPKLVIVGRSIGMWPQAQVQSTAWEYFFGERTMRSSLANLPFSLEEHLKIALFEFLPSIRLRVNLSRRLFGTLQDTTTEFSTMEKNLGYIPSYARMAESVRFKQILTQVNLFPHENIALLHLLCQQAVDHQFPMIFVSVPHAVPAGSETKKDVFPQMYDQFITDELQKVSPQFCYYISMPAYADFTSISDEIHLNDTGATLFTTALSERIKPFLSASGSSVQMKGR